MSARTYLTRADELQPGDVIPLGGLVGTVTALLASADDDGRIARIRVTVRTAWGATAMDVLRGSDAVPVERTYPAA